MRDRLRELEDGVKDRVTGRARRPCRAENKRYT